MGQEGSKEILGTGKILCGNLGTQGTVFKVTLGNQNYAQKVANFKTPLVIWENEMKINQRLIENNVDFTNIVKMVYSNQDCMVFELMDYTLIKYIENTKYKKIQHESQLKPIIQQIINGLDVLHNNNISYGDLKPENILVKVMQDGSIRIKLADFGCSKFLDSIEYQSPQMIKKKNDHFQNDMYSLGVAIHELWFQAMPKVGNDIYNIALNLDIKKPTSLQLITILQSLIVNQDKRVNLEQLKNNEYWNYKLLQPFPGMIILPKVFQLFQNIKFPSSGELIQQLKMMENYKMKSFIANENMLEIYTNKYDKMVEDPENQFEPFVQNIRTNYVETQKQ